MNDSTALLIIAISLSFSLGALGFEIYDAMRIRKEIKELTVLLKHDVKL